MNYKVISISLGILVVVLMGVCYFASTQTNATPIGSTQAAPAPPPAATALARHSGNTPAILDKPSQNFHNRIQTIVVHYTAAGTEESLSMLIDGKASSHYLIPPEGEPIYRLVADDKVAWHAGASSWRGKTHINDTSIGVEIVNIGIEPKYLNFNGFHPYSHYVDYEEGQLMAVGKLLRYLSEVYQIHPKNIVAHSDIAPDRKTDPGAKFNWEWLYRQFGVGAWYDEEDKRAFLASRLEDTTVQTIKEELRQYGYKTNDTPLWDFPTKQVIYAFQLHFNPKNATGVMDRETYAILKALNKKYSK